MTRTILFVAADQAYFLSHRLHLALAAREAGYAVALAAPSGSARSAIEAAGVAVHPLRLRRGSLNPLREFLALADLVRIFRAVRPSLAHLVAVKPILYGVLAARVAGVPTVVCAPAGLGHLYLGQGRGTAYLRRAAEGVYRRLVRGRAGTRVIVQNPDDRDLFLDRGLARAEQVTEIPGSGVDLERFSPVQEPLAADPPTVLLHGRMLWDKGVGELVEAARLLRDQGRPVRVVLAGDPDRANPASIPRDRLLAWDREGLVRWIGRREDVPELLGQAHVACLPSYREGLPLSLLEAAASGRPVVATDVPGCREAVIHGRTGFLVPARDPGALADALGLLRDDLSLRRRMGAEGRRLAEERFGRRTIAAQTLAVYHDLLGAA